MALALKFVPPAEISAKIVLDVSRMFLKYNGASRMGFLNGSPQDKLIDPLVMYLLQRGATLRTGAKVRAMVQDGPRSVVGVRLETREEVRADAVVLALPIHQLNRLIPTEWRQDTYFERLSHFEGVPVMTMQLWLDRQVTGINNILFCPDGRIPVYADLGNTTPDYFVGGRSRIETVVAPARDLMDRDDSTIMTRVWNDLQAVFPASTPGAQIRKSTVVRIPQSVYWPRPGLDALRPTQRTPVEHLYLVGGYTIQHFYDSMEGAVSSGRTAARALIEDAPRLPHSKAHKMGAIEERL